MNLPGVLFPPLLVALLLQDPPAPIPPSPPPAAKVVAAVAKCARENAALPLAKRESGGALADLLVRRAAAGAAGDPRAFLLGLAHAVDPAATLAHLPLTADGLRGVETEPEAKARIDALGLPLLRGRNDLLLHFAVSAALRAEGGEGMAEMAGLAKETADSRGGSGFSFADLLADLAGIRFSGWLLEKDGAARLKRVAEGFTGDDFLPDPSKEPEGLQEEEFAKRYGTAADERFLAKRKALVEAVAAMPGYRVPGK